VCEGKRFYTIVESGRNLNIEFKGDAQHLPETILTLRTQQVDGRTLYEIESWLTPEDVQRFALIRQELRKDLQQLSLESNQPGLANSENTLSPG
jgi:hypothetical protein